SRAERIENRMMSSAAVTQGSSLHTPRRARRLAIIWFLPVLWLAMACEQPVGSANSQPAPPPPPPPPPPGTRVGYYVSPSGSPSGDGSAARPWDLRTALAQPAVVHPGDTIWLRGGTYSGGAAGFTSNLLGTPSTPIVVRQYPGERATLTDR